MDKVKKFINEHKLLVIGLILYIIMYIFSQNFNPWQEKTEMKTFSGMKYTLNQPDAIDLYMPNLNVENRILDKIPLNILYFGVSDAAEAVHSGISVLFALITYSSVAMGFFMDRYYKKHNNIKKPERWIIAHLYDNVLFYLVSIAIRLLQPVNDIIIDNIDNFFPWLSNTFDGNIGLKLLGVVVLILTLAVSLLLVLIPMLPSVLYFFGYIVALKGIHKIIEFADGKLFSGAALPREIVIFIIAFVLIMVMNVIIEQIYEFIQDLSLKPVCLTAKGIKRGVKGLTDKFRRN